MSIIFRMGYGQKEALSGSLIGTEKDTLQAALLAVIVAS